MKDKKFLIVDILYILGIILPLALAVTLKVLFTPASEGVAIHGAIIFFTIPMPIQDLPITESQVNSWCVLVLIAFLCLFLVHGVKEKCGTKRQLVAEWIVEKVDGLVKDNMGEFFMEFSPFICAILALSAFSSLMTLVGLYPPTSDINVVAGWAILVFFLITHYKLKGGVKHYLKGFTEPIVAFTPINIISEVATPLAMSFRHYGNVLSGTVISALVATALQGLSGLVLGWIPVIGDIPFLQIGIPAVLSVYFDIFSGCLQAFIFAMLTMLYVSGGFPADLYQERMKKKEAKKKK
ncbi:MAG: F0F1 ATP synthase subunit A [Clostridia bacterium]|nr:F0F1 ATP synthase subunit A [Clostridia bacterium]